MAKPRYRKVETCSDVYLLDTLTKEEIDFDDYDRIVDLVNYSQFDAVEKDILLMALRKLDIYLARFTQNGEMTMGEEFLKISDVKDISAKLYYRIITTRPKEE